MNSGRKLIPTSIFKGTPLITRSRRNSIEVELRDHLPDNSGNHNPPEENLFLTDTKSAGLIGEASVNSLRYFILPGIGIQDGKIVGVIVDYFKGLSRDVVKAFTRIFLIRYDITPVEQR